MTYALLYTSSHLYMHNCHTHRHIYTPCLYQWHWNWSQIVAGLVQLWWPWPYFFETSFVTSFETSFVTVCTFATVIFSIDMLEHYKSVKGGSCVEWLNVLSDMDFKGANIDHIYMFYRKFWTYTTIWAAGNLAFIHPQAIPEVSNWCNMPNLHETTKLHFQ